MLGLLPQTFVTNVFGLKETKINFSTLTLGAQEKPKNGPNCQSPDVYTHGPPIPIGNCIWRN